MWDSFLSAVVPVFTHAGVLLQRHPSIALLLISLWVLVASCMVQPLVLRMYRKRRRPRMVLARERERLL